MKNRIERAKKFLESKGYKLCYVGLYGSQNYGLDVYDEEYKSDFDFKAVCIPTLRQLVNNSKPVSKSYEFEGGLIDIKDIRIWTETILKCNPAYIETLFTSNCWYSDDYRIFIDSKEKLLSEMGIFLIKGAYGMMLEKEKAFSHPYPTIKDKINKFGYDPKQYHHIIRLFIMIQDFILNEKYILEVPKVMRQDLINIKKGSVPLKRALEHKDELMVQAKELRNNYKKEPVFTIKNKLTQASKDLIYNSINKQLGKQ